MRFRLLLSCLLLLLPLACAPESSPTPSQRKLECGRGAPILDSPPCFGRTQFLRSCVESRGYSRAQCECALRAVRQRFGGEDRDIALLYLQLTLIAEHDVEAIMAWLDPSGEGRCLPKPSGTVVSEIVRRHLAPGYYYGVLKYLKLSPERFETWEHRDEILAVRDRCLPPPASVMRQARQIEGCLEQALQIKHCSRCHDYRGVDLTD